MRALRAIVVLLAILVLMPGGLVLVKDSLTQGCRINCAKFSKGYVDIHLFHSSK